MKHWMARSLGVLALAGNLAFTTAHANVTFNRSYLRYLSGHDLIRVIKGVFPDAVDFNCTMLTADNRRFLGDPLPKDGETMLKSPGASYMRWLTGCVTQSAIEQSRVNQGRNVENYVRMNLGANAYLAIMQLDPRTNYSTQSFIGYRPWSNIPAVTQREIAKHLIHRLIGPGIVPDENAMTEFMINILNTNRAPSDLDSAIRDLILITMWQPEFLTY